MKYAVIFSGGKQYRVSEGDTIDVEKMAVLANDSISFDNVLLSVADQNVVLGKPYVAGVVVKASVVEQRKGEKIRVAKFKAKVRYRRVAGHRQRLTRVKIDQIVISGGEEKKTTRTVKKK